MLQSANRFPNSNYWTETHSNGKGIYISCFQLDPFIYDRSLLGVGVFAALGDADRLAIRLSLS